MSIIGNAIGGGAGIDLKIVSGATPPAAPKNNTIWLQTTTAVHNVTIGNTAPSAPVDGDVWIQNGLSANALTVCKKPSLSIYAQNIQMYISGAWKHITSQTYVNNAWHNNVLYIINAGVLQYAKSCVYLSYNIFTNPTMYTINDAATLNPALLQTVNGQLDLTSTLKFNISSAFFVPVDLTPFSTIQWIGTSYARNSQSYPKNNLYFAYWNAIPDNQPTLDAYAKGINASSSSIVGNSTSGSPFNITLDISADTGVKYVGAFLRGEGAFPNGAKWTSVVLY